MVHMHYICTTYGLHIIYTSNLLSLIFPFLYAKPSLKLYATLTNLFPATTHNEVNA